ncbi:hypothetical protein DVH05_026583 [Phytophthora capsici]|nr:hypothetical protein DVH05_026583 [Phytophthora capsici]
MHYTVAQLKSKKDSAEVENRMRSRSNSLGSEAIVRLDPLPNTPKPLVQEFLIPPEVGNIVPISEPDVVQEVEVGVSSPDPEVVIYPPVELSIENIVPISEPDVVQQEEVCMSSDPEVLIYPVGLPIESEEGIALVTRKEIVDELPEPEFQTVTAGIQALENGDSHIVETTLTTDAEIQEVEPTAFQLRSPLDNEQVVSPHQTARKECWEEPELPVQAEVKEEAAEDDAEMETLPERYGNLSERPVVLEMKGPSFTEIPSFESDDIPLKPPNLPSEVSLHSQQSNYNYGEVLSYDNNEGREDQDGGNESGIHFTSTEFPEHSVYNSLEIPGIGEAEGEDEDESDPTNDTNYTVAGGMESNHNAEVDTSWIGAIEDIVLQSFPLGNDSGRDQVVESAADTIDEASNAPSGDEPSSARMKARIPLYAEELLTRGTSDLLHEKSSEDTYPIQEENHSEDSTSFQQTVDEERRVKISAKSKTLTTSTGPTSNLMLKANTTLIGPHKQDSSPQRQKSGGCRRRSLSPTKRYDPNQAKMSVKEVGSRRRSTVAKVANPLLLGKPRLERSHSVEDLKQEILTASRSSNTNASSDTLPDLPSPSSKLHAKPSPQKSPGPILRSKSQESAKRQSKVVQSVSNYHKKWGKWIAGKNLVEKVGCLQLEELVMADPQNEENLLKLGLRYARWSSTSMQAILLLEHAALLHKNATGTREYWFWLGSAHLDIFMRHRKYLPVARFHLSRSIRAFTSAFAYIESLADPILLLRYAIGLFWHKGDGNLEKTRDIFHELFSQFVSFCDKDRPNLLFLQFQVLHRLKLYVDAIDCMNRIISLHESLPNQSPSSSAAVLPLMNTLQHFAVYDTADYRLMLMQCQQAGGDYVAAAQSLASILKHEGMQQDTVVRDEEYFDLWFSLAEKCFLHEDYALALEYYAIALNFAKQSQALAAIHYNLGLCFQSLGEDNKCTTEYKRARTANRHVPPLVSLVELTTSYDERFVQLCQKSVVQTIEEVRVELYGRAVRRLQRVFRKSRRNLNININNSSSEASPAKIPSFSKRRSSIAAARNLPALVRIEDTGDETEAHEEESLPQQVLPVDGNQTSKVDDSALEDVERRHESFLVRKQAAMEEMVQLLANPQYRGREVSNTRFKATAALRSGFLSPEKDQLDVRRKQSMETYRQVRCYQICSYGVSVTNSTADAARIRLVDDAMD